VGCEGDIEGVDEEFQLGEGFGVIAGGRCAWWIGGVGGVGEVVDCKSGDGVGVAEVEMMSMPYVLKGREKLFRVRRVDFIVCCGLALSYLCY